MSPGVGSLAIVLHSHMPYVEGFGTYPVRRGVAVRRRLPFLRAGHGRCPGRDPQRDARAGRPARGGRSGGQASRVRRHVPRRLGRGRRRRRRSRAASGLRRGGTALPPGACPPGRPGRRPSRPLSRAGAGGPSRAARVRGNPRRAAAGRHDRRAPATGRRRPALAPPALRRARRVLASRVRVRARARGAARRAGPRVLLRRPVRPRGGHRGAGAGGDARGPGGVHDRLGGGLVAVVSGRLSLGSRPRRLPPRVAARHPALGDRRAHLRAGGGRGARPRAGARVRRVDRAPPRGLPGRAGEPRAGRVRDRHRAARPLVVGGPGVAGGGHTHRSARRASR